MGQTDGRTPDRSITLTASRDQRKVPFALATKSKQHGRMLQVERFFRQSRMLLRQSRLLIRTLLRHCCRFLETMSNEISSFWKRRNKLNMCFHFTSIYKHPRTYKCSTMSPGNPFISRSNKGQRSRSLVTKTVSAWVFALLWVHASFSIHCQISNV